MNMTLSEFIFLTFVCWNESYQSLTIDMTRDKNTVHFRLGIKYIVVPDANLFNAH